MLACLGYWNDNVELARLIWLLVELVSAYEKGWESLPLKVLKVALGGTLNELVELVVSVLLSNTNPPSVVAVVDVATPATPPNSFKALSFRSALELMDFMTSSRTWGYPTSLGTIVSQVTETQNSLPHDTPPSFSDEGICT